MWICIRIVTDHLRPYSDCHHNGQAKIFCFLNFENLFFYQFTIYFKHNGWALHTFIRLKDSSLFVFGKKSKYACERIKSLTLYLKRVVEKGHLAGVLGTRFMDKCNFHKLAKPHRKAAEPGDKADVGGQI